MCPTEVWPTPELAPEIPIHEAAEGGGRNGALGAAHLVKLVHVVGQQVDDLAGGGLPHGRVAEAKRLAQKRGRENYTPTVTRATLRKLGTCGVFVRGLVCSQENRSTCDSRARGTWGQPSTKVVAATSHEAHGEEEKARANAPTPCFDESGNAPSIKGYILRSRLQQF